MHRDILGSSSLIKKILWLRSSLPTSPRTFDQGWSPHTQRNPVNYYPCGMKEKCPQLRRETHTILEECDSSGIKPPHKTPSVFTWKSRAQAASCEPDRERNSNRNVQKSLEDFQSSPVTNWNHQIIPCVWMWEHTAAPNPKCSSEHPTPFALGFYSLGEVQGTQHPQTDFGSWGGALPEFLYNKLPWLKSAKLPLRALQNSINRNVVPANGCSKCLHPWGILDGEYINMRSEGPGRLSRSSSSDTGMMPQAWCYLGASLLSPGGGQDVLYGQGKDPSGHTHNQQCCTK